MYKPTEEELVELGFSTKYGTDKYHYTAETAKVSSMGFKFPQMVNYFADKNVFLLGAVFYFIPSSFDDLKVIMKAFSTNVNEKDNENR